MVALFNSYWRVSGTSVSAHLPPQKNCPEQHAQARYHLAIERFLFLLPAAILAINVQANDFICADGSMADAACWSDGLPISSTASSSAALARIYNGGTANLSGGNVEAYTFSTGASSTVLQSGGILYTEAGFYSGYIGTGTIYELSGGELFTGFEDHFDSTFIQTGGVHGGSTSYGSTSINLRSGSALYELRDGILNSSINVLSGRYMQSGGQMTGYLNLQGDQTAVISGGTATIPILTANGYGALPQLQQTGGTINAGTLNVGRSLNNGVVALNNGNLNVINEYLGQSSANGTVEQSGGQHIVTNTLYLGDIYSGQGEGNFLLSGGVLRAATIDTVNSGAAHFAFEGGTLIVDTYIGDLSNQGGVFAPGFSQVPTVVTGDYTQSSSATLSFQIGGLTPGLDHNALYIFGTASLAGVLEVHLSATPGDPFQPAAGDSFDLLTADTILGEFNSLLLPNLGANMFWQTDYIRSEFDTDILRVSVISAVPLPPAAWLLGSGIFGLAAIRHRKGA